MGELASGVLTKGFKFSACTFETPDVMEIFFLKRGLPAEKPSYPLRRSCKIVSMYVDTHEEEETLQAESERESFSIK